VLVSIKLKVSSVSFFNAKCVEYLVVWIM